MERFNLIKSTIFLGIILMAPQLVFGQPAGNAEVANPAAVGAQPVAPAANGVVADGKTVRFDYSLAVDGKEIENSKGLEPIEYVQGQGNIIPGLEKALVGLKVGDEKDVHIDAADGYGDVDAAAIQEVPRNLIPADIQLAVGTLLQMNDDKGNVFPATVLEIKEDKVKLDFNHPLAGKALDFHIKILEIK